MKAVIKLAERFGLEVHRLQYRHNGFKSNGYALYYKTHVKGVYSMLSLFGKPYPEVFTIEPTFNKDKTWKVTDNRPNGNGLQYLKASQFDQLL